MKYIEECEWTNAWCDKLHSDNVKRTLLIGDSITLGYRPFVRDMAEGKFTADMFATSRVLDNEDYFVELNQVLKDVKYDVIHFNNGLHGWHQTEEEYKNNIERGISFIKEKQPQAQLILVTSTARTEVEHPEIKHKENEIILKRNEIIKELAKKYSLPLDDLYPVTENRPELHIGDGYHYKEDGSRTLAKKVYEMVASLV